jgi:hypothetical protein|tara:strand:+ start:7981 stop:8334 length:354 start_codon:yes stop_codon:yes gene_type:complete
METKDQLVSHIKEWISIDEEVKLLKKEIKIRQERKKNLTQDLVEVMKSNEIDAFDINNGKLIYTKRKTKQAISKKLLLSSLQDMFETPEEVNKITEHILESRSEKIKEIIRRKTNKN